MVANVSATFGQRPFKRKWQLLKIGSDIMAMRGNKKKKKKKTASRGGQRRR